MTALQTALSRPALTRVLWEFGQVGRGIYATQLRLLEDGRIGGYRNANENRWDLRDGVLVLLDRAAVATTIFDQVGRQNDRLVLEGGFVGGDARHFLRETDPIGALLPAKSGVTATARAGLVPRRNLIILRAGEKSLHAEWAQDIQAADRSWDLCISWYDSPARFEEDARAEYHVIQSDLQKYEAIHQLLHVGSPFWQYEYVMLPDDDLAWSWRGINVAFESMRDFDLLLGQPALERAGHPIHDITRRARGNRLRYTSFVEVMTPIFSREALRTCAPTFSLSRSGFGLDHVWPTLLGQLPHRIGIIDDTGVVHTRPQAVNYNLSEAIAEGRDLTARFKARERYEVVGSIQALD